MADISQVEMAMVALIAESLGGGSRYIPGSVVVSPAAASRCCIYRGWPVKGRLDADLAAGISHITVFPIAGATRRTTKYLPQWHQSQLAVSNIAGMVNGNVITLSGTGGPGQVAGVLYGPEPGRLVVAYRLRVGDTPASVAAALSLLIAGSTAVGPRLTVPAGPVEFRVAADQPEWLETRRQAQHVWVTGWCSTPAARDALMSAVDAGIANMTDSHGHLTYFLPLPDGSAADIRYYSNHTDDTAQQNNLWRRDLRYTVEYPTTLLEDHPRVLFASAGVTNIDAQITVDVGDGYLPPTP